MAKLVRPWVFSGRCSFCLLRRLLYRFPLLFNSLFCRYRSTLSFLQQFCALSIEQALKGQNAAPSPVDKSSPLALIELS
jgi:hypothetical protein